MYTNLQAELNSGFPLVGNPNLEPEKTIGYEFGVSHMVDANTALKLVTYYRDISNLTSTRLVNYGTGSYTEYVNADYGSVKGFDAVLSKGRWNSIAGSINYSFMIARGNASYPYEGYYDYFTNDTNSVYPVREYPLAFDQRHTLSVNLDYRTPRDHKSRIFGVKVPSSAGLNVLFSYGSGMPYTKSDNDGNRVGLPNEGRMPAAYSVDLKLNKDIYFSKTSESFITVFVEVENLFDRRNVINVYSNTGKPDDDGWDPSLAVDLDGDGTTVQETEVRRLLANDPQNFDTPRQIRWGLEVIF
jgi:outer membrane receptor for ferrienterochelin and colicin